MDRSKRTPELQVEIELLSGVGARQLPAWRPNVRPIDSSSEALTFGVVFVSSPQRAAGGERFVANLVVLAWPDPTTDWLHQPGVAFNLTEGSATIGHGRVLAVGGVSGIDA